MRMEPFEMERMQSTWENVVELDMSESGVAPVTLRELVEMGFDLESFLDVPLGYSQSNGTVELRELLSNHYPGSTTDHLEVTNGTSEANYLVALSLLRPGDIFALQQPNYMQLWGVPRSVGAEVRTFRMVRAGGRWRLDLEQLPEAIPPGTRLVYVSNPHNPTGAVLTREEMGCLLERCDEVGAYLLADEVYRGAEIEVERTPSFWGMSERVIVTSGLSKAYGIPGVRIGWIAGPPDVVRQCWTQHDYLTIGPNKLSDALARTAVRLDTREKLYERTRALLKANLPLLREFAKGLGDSFELYEPEAGAICLVKYPGNVPSLALAERIRTRQSTLVVPGSQMGLEGHLRIWMGGRKPFLEEGLRRIARELQEQAVAAR